MSDFLCVLADTSVLQNSATLSQKQSDLCIRQVKRLRDPRQPLEPSVTAPTAMQDTSLQRLPVFSTMRLLGTSDVVCRSRPGSRPQALLTHCLNKLGCSRQAVQQALTWIRCFDTCRCRNRIAVPACRLQSAILDANVLLLLR